MSKMDFLSAVLAPVGEGIIAQDERKNAEKLEQKRNQIALMMAALPNADDPNLILNEIYRLNGGGKKGKGGRPNEGMAMLETLIRENVGKKPAMSATFGGGDGGGTAENAAAGQVGRVLGEARDMMHRPAKFSNVEFEMPPQQPQVPVPTDLGELPFRLPTRAEREAREIELYRTKEGIETEGVLKRREGQMIPGRTKVKGSQIAPEFQVDMDGQPIDRTGDYTRIDRYGADPVFIREAGRVPTGAEAKIHEAARQLVAVAQSRGEELDFDTALNRARVDERLNTVRERQTRQQRLDQLLSLGDLAFKRGTQQYQQSAQMFPLLVAAREAGTDLSRLRASLLSGNPNTLMNQAVNMARGIVSQPGSGYYGKPLQEVADAMLETMGHDPGEIRARIEVMSSGEAPAPAPTAPVRSTPTPAATSATSPLDDPELRKKAKAALEKDKVDPTQANIDALLKDPAWVKFLREGGE